MSFGSVIQVPLWHGMSRQSVHAVPISIPTTPREKTRAPHRNIIVVNGVQSGRRRPSIVAVELKPLTKLHGAEDIGQTTLSIDGVTRVFAIQEQRSKTGAEMQ